ncbi:MAG: histidine phosphatase family protein [bacterium]|nr:histidine phosphatase family protein [bacterium]
MRLFLIRHAIAMNREDFTGSDDLLRPLTDVGRKKARRAFRGFQRMYGRPDLILHSAATRAIETAEILAQVTGAPTDQTKLLNPGADYAAFLKLMSEYGDAADIEQLVLVGHEPDFSEILSGLVAPAADAAKGRAAFLHFDIKKASCIEVDLHAPGSGELLNFLSPKALRRLGKGGD